MTIEFALLTFCMTFAVAGYAMFSGLALRTWSPNWKHKALPYLSWSVSFAIITTTPGLRFMLPGALFLLACVLLVHLLMYWAYRLEMRIDE